MLHVSQACRIPGSTAQIVVMNTLLEAWARCSCKAFATGPFNKAGMQTCLVLSFDAMKRRYLSKLVTCLLLTTFFLASTASVFGYAWCLGDDGHVEVSYSKGSGCCDPEPGKLPVARHIVPTITQSSDNFCSSCLDFSVQTCDAVFTKRVKRVTPPPVALLNARVFSPKVVQSTPWDVKLTSLLPRISQAILVHRTVVLLN